MLTVNDVSAEPLTIQLNQPFGIATGTQQQADNVLVRVTLDDGSVGLGEAAPFPAVNGETQTLALEVLASAAPALRALPFRGWRQACASAQELCAESPSAACALECALVDAWLRSHRCSMWSFFGGVESALESDITVPTGTPSQAADAAADALAMGFRVLKVKVGGVPLELDVERLARIAEKAPQASLVLDANASYSAEEALELLDRLGPARQRVTLFEQPTARDDLAGMRRVLTEGRVAVAADESARSAMDVVRLVAAGAVSAINVKIMKSGLSEALDMIALARRHGLDLMVGGMVESELAMSVSACIAGGIGGFRWVDLDTPLFMKSSPFTGGFVRSGSRLELLPIEAGHGVSLRERGVLS